MSDLLYSAPVNGSSDQTMPSHGQGHFKDKILSRPIVELAIGL